MLPHTKLVKPTPVRVVGSKSLSSLPAMEESEYPFTIVLCLVAVCLVMTCLKCATQDARVLSKVL